MSDAITRLPATYIHGRDKTIMLNDIRKLIAAANELEAHDHEYAIQRRDDDARIVFEALVEAQAKRGGGRKVCLIDHIKPHIDNQDLFFTNEEIRLTLNFLIQMKLVAYWNKTKDQRWYKPTDLGRERFQAFKETRLDT